MLGKAHCTILLVLLTTGCPRDVVFEGAPGPDVAPDAAADIAADGDADLAELDAADDPGSVDSADLVASDIGRADVDGDAPEDPDSQPDQDVAPDSDAAVDRDAADSTEDVADAIADTDADDTASDAGDLVDDADAAPHLILDVVPLFEVRGADWNQWVAVADGVAVDERCEPTSVGRYSDCAHAGELRTFEVPGRDSCDGLRAVDAFRLLAWECVDDGGVRFVSTGLQRGRGLTSILDTVGGTFLPNQVALYDDERLIGLSPLTEW